MGMPQDIPPRDADTGWVHVVVDTPAGSRNKYFPGCLVTVRLIGVADTPVNPARLGELSELDAEELRAIEAHGAQSSGDPA